MRVAYMRMPLRVDAKVGEDGSDKRNDPTIEVVVRVRKVDVVPRNFA